MTDALLAALRARPRLAGLSASNLAPMRAKGTAHGHVRIVPRIAGRALLARICFAHPGDPGAALRLRVQAAAFRHAAASGAAPRLSGCLEPSPGLPGGALLVEAIDGRAPRLPAEFAAIADTLAALHRLPLPGPRSLLPRQTNPFLETLAVVERHAALHLDAAVPEPGARAEIAEELRAMRGMAAAFALKAQPLAFALADTQPGNFVVDAAGKAWFVDLEKAGIGSAAVDLAHATLETSTRWDPDIDMAPSPADVAAFHARYLGLVGRRRARALAPWLMPMRRLVWLRTTLFFARWRNETRAPRDPANPGQWSDAGLDPAMRAHVDRTIDRLFRREAIRAIRAQWLGPDALDLAALV